MKNPFYYAVLLMGLFAASSCSKCYTCTTPIIIETPDGDTIVTDAVTEQKTCDKGSMEQLVGQGYRCVQTQ